MSDDAEPAATTATAEEQLILRSLATATFAQPHPAQDLVTFGDADQPKAINARLVPGGFLTTAPLHEYYVQEKLNGVKLIHCGRRTFGKSGHEWRNIPPFFSRYAMPPVPLVGELYAGPGQLGLTAPMANVSKTVTAKKTSGVWLYHRFVVYDIPGLYSMPYGERYRLLRDFVRRWNAEILARPAVLGGDNNAGDQRHLPLQCINAWPAHTHWRELFREVIQQPARRTLPPWGPHGAEDQFLDARQLRDMVVDPQTDVPLGEGLMFYHSLTPWHARHAPWADAPTPHIGTAVQPDGRQRPPALLKFKPALLTVGIVRSQPKATISRWHPEVGVEDTSTLPRNSLSAKVEEPYHGYTVEVDWRNPISGAAAALKTFIPLTVDALALMAHLHVGDTLPFLFNGMNSAQFPVPINAVAILSFGRAHLSALEKCLAAQDFPVTRLTHQMLKMRSELIQNGGRVRADGILRSTVLPLFPPTPFHFLRVLLVRPRQPHYPLLLPKMRHDDLYVEDHVWRIPPRPPNRMANTTVRTKVWSVDHSRTTPATPPTQRHRAWLFFLVVVKTIHNYEALRLSILNNYRMNTDITGHRLYQQRGGQATGVVTRWWEWDAALLELGRSDHLRGDIPIVLSCIAAVWYALGEAVVDTSTSGATVEMDHWNIYWLTYHAMLAVTAQWNSVYPADGGCWPDDHLGGRDWLLVYLCHMSGMHVRMKTDPFPEAQLLVGLTDAPEKTLRHYRQRPRPPDLARTKLPAIVLPGGVPLPPLDPFDLTPRRIIRPEDLPVLDPTAAPRDADRALHSTMQRALVQLRTI